jgi:hypothetical protein
VPDVPPVRPDVHVYSSRRRQWLLAGSMIAVLLVSLSVILEPDPETGVRPVPGDYLWVVIPGVLLILVLAWRALRVNVTTDTNGIDITRTLGHERVGWAELRRFEVHPTPGRQGFVVRARLHNEVLVNVWNEIEVRPLRDRDEARRIAKRKADAMAAALDADRLRHQPSPVAGAGAGSA